MSAPQPTHWIDTSVMIDFDSTISMTKNMRHGPESIRETRRSMQRAAWLAMACDEVGAVSISFDHEHSRKLLGEAPPDTVAGQWTHAVMNIVRPHVCPRWTVRHTSEGATVRGAEGERPADNDERDQFMIDASKRHQLLLVTNDGGAIRRASKCGVNAYRPHEYAAQVISFDEARERFMSRLDAGIRAFIAQHREGQHLYDNANVIWDVYEGVWDVDLQ